MPPKAKFSKEEIVTTALAMVKQQGIEALTARSLAKELGSSARPIFTVFASMEEVQAEVRNAVLTPPRLLYHITLSRSRVFY